MPTTPRKGKIGLYVELPEELDAALRRYCGERGLKIADEVRLALRRHLASPPVMREPDPLPIVERAPSAAPDPPADRKKPAGRTSRKRGG